MNPETILALLQLIRFGADTIEKLQNGEMTDEEYAAEWAKVRNRVDNANDLWEQAGS